MVRNLAALAASLALAACQGSGAAAPSGGDVRQTAATAPADLQLTCASAATTQLGLGSDTVLPTASTATADGYQVSLSFTNGAATCLVRNDGTVVSVTRV